MLMENYTRIKIPTYVFFFKETKNIKCFFKKKYNMLPRQLMNI